MSQLDDLDDETPAPKKEPASDARRALAYVLLTLHKIDGDLRQTCRRIDGLTGVERTAELAKLGTRLHVLRDSLDEAGNTVIKL